MGKLLIPVGLVPVANALEGKVVVLGSPLIASIQSRGNSLLQAADTCVDHFLGATKTYSSAAGGSLQTYQAKGVKALQQARASVELTTKQALEYMKKVRQPWPCNTLLLGVHRPVLGAEALSNLPWCSSMFQQSPASQRNPAPCRRASWGPCSRRWTQ